MTPLVKKEIRLLLPNTIICCALGLANFLFTFNNDGSLQYLWGFLLAFVFCGGVAVMLALNSFGAEISSGAFSNLLAQPIPRQKIWDTKILLLALSLLMVAVFWSGCGIVRLAMIGHDLNLLDLFTGVGTFGLVVFSGGLWTVLLLRQIAAAFWFTVLVPGCLLVLLAGLFADHSSEFIEGMTVCVLGLYSLAGFFFARWLFFRAQDLQWTGGTLVLPEMRGLARLKSFAGSLGAQTPRAALWRKEIQLHQSQFVIAFGLLVLHLGVIATRKLGHFNKNSTTELVLESFWTLWMVMPLLVGCAAVAEERRLGTHESQLCLPVKRRTQFRIKLLVALGLSLFFGVLMPLLLEGPKILPNAHFNFSQMHSWSVNGTGEMSYGQTLDSLNHLVPVLLFAGVIVLIGGISFYVSTLGRNTLQTLTPAVAGVVLTWFLLMVATIPMRSNYWFDSLWHGPLPYFIVFPAMAVTLLALAKENYQHVLSNWKLDSRNLLMLATVFVLSVTLTSAIYHRVWEKFTPVEPPHGSARLTLANPPTLSASAQGSSLFLSLPDGRTWTGAVEFDRDTTHLEAFLGNIKMILNDHLFISGSNWLTANRAFWDLVGIKTDGTLWVSEKPRFAIRQQGKWKIINEEDWRHLVQFGAETNWSSLVPWNTSVLLTKNDGTLWHWGPQSFHYDEQTNRWPGLRSFTPVRLGDESNWVEAFQFRRGFGLRKTDGSVWRSLEGATATNGYTLLEVEPDFWLFSTHASHQQKFYSTAEIYNGLTYRTGIRDDGTFRIWEHLVPILSRKQNYTSYVWTNIDLQIGAGTNWLAVAGMGNQAVTLKNDGSLWLWNFPDNRNWLRDQDQIEREILDTVPVQLGTHSDWIAISCNGYWLMTLAADGSLWYWPIGDFQWTVYDEDNIRITQLLDISRKPQLLGNVFDSAR